MILNDDMIEACCLAQPSLVEPYNPDLLQPASLDLRLGNEFKVFVPHGEMCIEVTRPDDITRDVYVADDDYFVLHPSEFILGVTMEKFNLPSHLVGRLEGKSSLGRLGLIVHATAGFVDPGFRGPLTLEMMNFMRIPLVLRPGMQIAQISFYCMVASARNPYNGRYQDAISVQASKAGQS